MRVLHLAAGNLFGGVETHLLTLARLRHLWPAMEPHYGLCFPGRLRDELLGAGVPVHDLGAVRVSRPWTVLTARFRLRRILREQAFGVVIAHGAWPHVVFAPVVKRAGVRLVNFVHGKLDRRVWLDRWAARTPPDAVIANSHFTAAAARQVFRTRPAAVVYPPVPLTESFDHRAARCCLRDEFATPTDAVVVLIVSRIEEQKGHAVLFAALHQLRDVPGWVCWVVGGAQQSYEAALLRELRTATDRLGIAGRVRFTGPRSDVPAVMAAADVYCQPNTGPEGFGLVFAEAMRAGLPVVTSGIGGAAEVVTAECGVLCSPGDAGAVADALRGLILDSARRRKLGAAGPGRAAEMCDPTRQMGALIRLLLGGANGTS